MKHLTIHLARPGMNPFCAFWQRAVVMLFVMFTSMGMWATDYIDENGKPQSHNCTSFPDEGVNATTLSTGWYAVDRNVVYNYLCKRITINGDVKIIIQDGCSLRATFGIGVPEGSTLTIYGSLATQESSKLYLIGIMEAKVGLALLMPASATQVTKVHAVTLTSMVV